MSQEPSPQTVRETYAVPAAVSLAVEGPLVLAWEADGEGPVRVVASDPGSVEPVPLAGRAPLGRLPAPGGPVLVRTYRKGGLFRGVRGRVFRSRRYRPLDELVLHHDLAHAGGPVVEALGCVVRQEGGGWTGSLLVREVDGALDLEAWLYGNAAGLALSDAAAILQRAGRAVRWVHDAGVEHADLHPKNLLLTPAGRVLVIDLDNAQRRAGPLEQAARVRNLARFQRAIEKHLHRGMPATRWDPSAFFAGYAEAAEAGEPSADPATWGAIVRSALGGLTLRKLWWSLAGSPRTPRGESGS